MPRRIDLNISCLRLRNIYLHNPSLLKADFVLTTADIVSGQRLHKNRGDQEVMRRKRIDPKVRGLVCAVKRANAIGAKGSADNIRASGASRPASTGRRHDRTPDAVELLSETLAEEKHADELLTSIADGGVNESATERPQAADAAPSSKRTRSNTPHEMSNYFCTD